MHRYYRLDGPPQNILMHRYYRLDGQRKTSLFMIESDCLIILIGLDVPQKLVLEKRR